MPTPLFEKGRAKTGGRQTGTQNKLPRSLRETAFAAAAKAVDGTFEDWLIKQAKENPTAYLAFLGRFIPQQLIDEADKPVVFQRVIRLIVDPKQPDEPRVIEARKDN
jgi:hypothetical protein